MALGIKKKKKKKERKKREKENVTRERKIRREIVTGNENLFEMIASVRVTQFNLKSDNENIVVGLERRNG